MSTTINLDYYNAISNNLSKIISFVFSKYSKLKTLINLVNLKIDFSIELKTWYHKVVDIPSTLSIDNILSHRSVLLHYSIDELIL